ncbi:hypothetical protein Q3W71_15575 [Micromonospora sp. C28SCA-DRY-2]|uniref:hypothetical protein n=1 Tax=Micromonospora sp. C28SCA-DRY-2 TaxID=3059522 RepID=UPI00267500CE|nr:hypothetical protein [Micromonospora sp. C28SCA-DRY-2]MDO3703090.1 hypothetical protein [Micromonospora sp. C28SCA-DRY-2]
MLAHQVTRLRTDVPAGLTEALDVVAGFDAVLTRGFARIGEEDAAALAALADAVAGTPLGARVAEAVGKVTAGSVAEEHLAVLAGARSALLGAAHDALLGQLDGVLGRDRSPWPGAAAGATEVSPARLAARAWLHEVALTGWRGVDHELVSGAAAPVEDALAEPGSRRLAVLLDGLAAELRACVPVAAMPQAPVRRWADLWARGMLLTQGAPAGPAADVELVSGRLLPLGVDVHEHDTAVQVGLHAVLEPAGGGTPRLVRATVGAAKVATIVGPAIWRLFPGQPTLLRALAGRRAVTVTDLPLHGGDLRWDDTRAELGEPTDPFATARVLLASATAASTPPLDRHPAAIAEPVLVEGAAVRDDGGLVLDLDGERVPVTVDRLPASGPLTRGRVAAATACLGLLRWDDGRWLLQPLGVRFTSKRQVAEAHNGDWADGVTDPKIAKADAKAGDAVAVLRERAGRLLRR